MSAIDDAIRKHAENLQRCYDDRTAGDHSFIGALAMFLLDVTPLIEERGAAKVRSRVEAVAAEWEADDAEHLAGWGHHLPVSLGGMAGHLRAALGGDS